METVFTAEQFFQYLIPNIHFEYSGDSVFAEMLMQGRERVKRSSWFRSEEECLKEFETYLKIVYDQIKYQGDYSFTLQICIENKGP